MKDKFFIREISEIVGLPSDTIRYYDKIGLLSPLREGCSNYRHFDECTVGNMHSIMFLRNCQLSIEKISAFYDNRDIIYLRKALLESQADILDRINELYRQQAEVLRFYSFLNQIWPKYDTISIRQSPQWYVVYTGKDRDMERIIKQYTHIEQDKGLIPTYAYFLSPQSFSARCYSDFCNRGVVTDSAYTDDQSLPLLIPSQKCAYYVFCEKQTSPMNHIYDALHDWLDIHRANVCGDVMERFILNTSEHKIGEVWVPIRLPED